MTSERFAATSVATDLRHDLCHATGVGVLRMPFQADDTSLARVVDDDASVRGALESLFETVGLETQTDDAAQEFLGVGLPDRPGCVVVDVRLPDVNGLEIQAQWELAKSQLKFIGVPP
jgi:FixJ family two-component response regulator